MLVPLLVYWGALPTDQCLPPNNLALAFGADIDLVADHLLRGFSSEENVQRALESVETLSGVDGSRSNAAVKSRRWIHLFKGRVSAVS